MRRRDLIALAGAVLARPALAAPELPRLAVLLATDKDEPVHVRGVFALQEGLRALGWEDGRNIAIAYSWGGGQPAQIAQMARRMVGLAPDVIVANGTPVVTALKPLTRTIPIVCAPVTDPVGFGFVQSLARPGGNITGFSFIDTRLLGKWTALLKEASPGLTRAGVLYNPKINAWYPKLLRDTAAAPGASARDLVGTPVETDDELRAAVTRLGATAGTGFIIGPEAFVIDHVKAVLASSDAAKMPGISVYREFVTAGGLMTYGPDLPDIFRLAAGYVDRILKGASPANLPVQEPTKFAFAVNRKAASALGLTLPATLLAGTDDVIE